VSDVILKIKTSQDTREPSSLSNGEIAYSYSSDKLFIGQTDETGAAVSVEYIGGKLLVDKVANLESQLLADSGAELSSLDLTDKFTLSYADENHVLMTKADGVIDFVTGTVGKVLQIAANGTPTFDDLNGGDF
jgi:hypothetical protein